MSRSRARRPRAGALLIGIPASAAVLTPLAASAILAPPAQAAPQNAIQIDVRSHRIAYGHDVVVTGAAPAAAAGEAVTLDFAPAGGFGWRQLASTTVAGAGRFRLAAPLRRSGAIRVLESPGGSETSFLAGGAGAAVSVAQPVQVGASLRVPDPGLSVLAGQAVEVRGRLLPALAGRRVKLQGRRGSAWQTLATARTRARGRFRLRYMPGAVGREPVRVRFSGDRTNGRATARVGQLTVYRDAVASWYDDAGSTACGFHAHYGVANKSLPCGSQVSFRYNGRSVTATVDDRGPYVAGREWDLNQNTAAALGFGGVGTVWSSM